MAGDMTLCRKCARTLRERLREYPSILDELSLTLTRQAAIVEQTTEGRSAENPIPFNVNAANQYRRIQRMLDHWINRIRPRGRITFVPIDAPTQARWLASRIHAIACHAESGELYRDVIATHRETLTMIDHPVDRSRFPVGPCPNRDDDSYRCSGTVWAIIPDTTERNPVLSCRTCETTWEAHEWTSVGRQILAAKAQ